MARRPVRGYGGIGRRTHSWHAIRAGLITDVVLAALALEHGLVVVSADSDFARFSELRWENPVSV